MDSAFDAEQLVTMGEVGSGTIFFSSKNVLSPTMNHLERESLSHPILIFPLLIFDPKFHWELCNKVVSLSLAKCHLEFEPTTFGS